MFERRSFIGFCRGLVASLFAVGHPLRKTTSDAQSKAELDFFEELFSIKTDTRQARQRDRISQVWNA
jgi:hypothetical protein